MSTENKESEKGKTTPEQSENKRRIFPVKLETESIEEYRIRRNKIKTNEI